MVSNDKWKGISVLNLALHSRSILPPLNNGVDWWNYQQEGSYFTVQHKLFQSLPVLANLAWLNLQEWITTSSLITLCQRNGRYQVFGCDINFQQHSHNQKIIYSPCIPLLSPLLTGISSLQNSTLNTATMLYCRDFLKTNQIRLGHAEIMQKNRIVSQDNFFFARLSKF